MIPAYKEADNLPVMVAEIWVLRIPGLSIVIVDDSSPDGKVEIANKMADLRPEQLFVIKQSGKHGLGRAYITGFKSAFELGSDYIVQMDGDCSFSQSYT